MKRTGNRNINTVGYWDQRYLMPRTWTPGAIVTTAARFIRPGESVLDVGVGGAVVFQHLASIISDLRYMGCDFSPMAIVQLQNSTDLAFTFDELFVHDIRQPMLGVMADVVISTETLEHLENPVKALANMAASTRRCLIVSVPARDSIPDREHLWEFEYKDVYNLLKPYGKPFVKHVRGGLNLLGAVKLCQ